MSLTMPGFINDAGVAGSPAKYKWSSKIAMDFDDGTENSRLYVAIDMVNFKAKIALGIVLTEWILWRFQGQTDLSDSLDRCEAAWASIVDVRYAKIPEIRRTVQHDQATVEGPIETAVGRLGDIVEQFAKGWVYLAGTVLKQAQLAKYLMPDKKSFEIWLSETLRRTAKTFPRLAEYDETTQVFDAAAEDPVPRTYFEQNSGLSKSETKKMISSFLQGLDPNSNQYLCAPAEMAAMGFPGKPYN